MFGVSPAYFLSRFGDRFTPHHVTEELTNIAQLGFRGFQLEVFHKAGLRDWTGGAKRVRRRSAELGIEATQFVAHFMMEAFSNPTALISDSGPSEMKYVLEIASLFDECLIITVPLPAFAFKEPLGQKAYDAYFARLTDKVGRLLELVRNAGRQLALEILPAALIGGIDGFLRLCDQLDPEPLYLNFDTGHAWAAKENLDLIPAKLGRRIVGTHLCDNFGHENVSLRPGAGSIDWRRLIAALKHVGYGGSLDLEIICESTRVRREYAAGLKFLDDIWDM
ncbi:MAG: sugar phosphate isomerase/epimerase family protein [Desulfatiglandaceae bacterium]